MSVDAVPGRCDRGRCDRGRSDRVQFDVQHITSNAAVVCRSPKRKQNTTRRSAPTRRCPTRRSARCTTRCGLMAAHSCQSDNHCGYTAGLQLSSCDAQLPCAAGTRSKFSAWRGWQWLSVADIPICISRQRSRMHSTTCRWAARTFDRGDCGGGDGGSFGGANTYPPWETVSVC